MDLQFPAAVPEIPVTDLAKALEYYKDCFGFNTDWSDAELGLAGISRDACRMFVADAGFRSGRGNVGPIMIWLNLNSKEEVNELHRLWKSSGATLLSEPESQPWFLHEFTAQDPDGNFFRVFYDFGTGDGVQ